MDRAVRRRYNAQKMIRKAYLSHVCHEIYMKKMREKIAEERRKRAEYRRKLRKQREEREKAILHRQATNINGTLVNMLWKKRDARACSLDMSVVMVVYVPTTSARCVGGVGGGELGVGWGASEARRAEKAVNNSESRTITSRVEVVLCVTVRNGPCVTDRA
jgi:hypothetical protein